MDQGKKNFPLWKWFLALVLILPATFPYWSLYLSSDQHFTGFRTYDEPSYMANAREHFDKGEFRPFYSNPMASDYDTPAIYFHVHMLVLGILLKGTGLAPGVLFLLFGFFFLWLASRIVLAIYEKVAGLSQPSHWIGLILFFWGGGVFFLTGLGMYQSTQPLWMIFKLDPGVGNWGMNFGRSLLYPMVVYYHTLFFGAVLALLYKKHRLSLACAFLLAMSHPQHGMQLLLILAVWSFLESYFIESDELPGYYFYVILAFIALVLMYNFLYLRSFSEHQFLMEQWKKDWSIKIENFLPAYFLVGAFFLYRIRKLSLARKVFSTPAPRLFLIWFLVSFALANHEFAMEPIQPVKFCRGYIWSALFLLALPYLIRLLNRLLSLKNHFSRYGLVALFMILFLVDNLTWFPIVGDREGLYLTRDQEKVLSHLGDRSDLGQPLVLCREEKLSYLTTCYTSFRSWAAHIHHTQNYKEKVKDLKEFYRFGKFNREWRNRPLILIVDKSKVSNLLKPDNFSSKTIYENNSYLVKLWEPKK